jgi:hypothetical protein
MFKRRRLIVVLLALSVVSALGVAWFFRARHPQGVLTPQNLEEAKRACRTQEQFEQYFGRPDSTTPDVGAGWMRVEKEGVTYAAWRDTLGTAPDHVYDHVIIIAFDPITKERVAISEADAPPLTMWERFRLYLGYPFRAWLGFP